MFTKRKHKNGLFLSWNSGRYYYKTSLFAPAKEISPELFYGILSSRTGQTQTDASEQGRGFAAILERYLEHSRNGTSEFGRRVQVVLKKGKQKPSKYGGVDVWFKLKVIDEKTGKPAPDLFCIKSELRGLTGPLTDRGVYYPELFRSLFQIAFNGCLANQEDIEAVKLSFGNPSRVFDSEREV